MASGVQGRRRKSARGRAGSPRGEGVDLGLVEEGVEAAAAHGEVDGFAGGGGDGFAVGRRGAAVGAGAGAAKGGGGAVFGDEEGRVAEGGPDEASGAQGGEALDVGKGVLGGEGEAGKA